MISIIFDILLVVVFAYFTALLTYFLDFCIGEPHGQEVKRGRIFSFYGKWIRKNYEKFEAETDRKRLKRMDKAKDLDDKIEADRFTRTNHWKAAGMCPVCFNVWISTGSFILFSYIFDISYLYLVPYIVFSNQFVRKKFNA